LGEDARRQPGDLGGMPLVEMKAARLHDDRHALERPGDELTPVTLDAWLGKTGDFGIGNGDGGDDFVREKTETGPQHDRYARLEPSETLADCLRRVLQGQRRIPANVADRKFASVPAIMARKPRRARSCLRSGASAPMPPI